MARPFYRLTSARLRFLVFLLLAVAVIAAQSQAQSQTPSAARPAATEQLAPLRGPLFRHVVDAGCRLGRLSWTVLTGHAGS